MTAGTLERVDVDPAVAARIATGVRRSIPCEWRGRHLELDPCDDPATWRLIPPCGHDGTLCDAHRVEWLDFALEARRTGPPLRCHVVDCWRVTTLEAIVWEQLG